MCYQSTLCIGSQCVISHLAIRPQQEKHQKKPKETLVNPSKKDTTPHHICSRVVGGKKTCCGQAHALCSVMARSAMRTYRPYFICRKYAARGS